MRVATWNVNSIRARVDRVTDWLARADVDVLAMQETKCSDDQFPTMPFAALGYDVVHCGFNQWNGVAIASRVGIDDVEVGFPGNRPGATSPRTRPPPRRGHWVRPAPACECGVCTSRTVALSTRPTIGTSWNGLPPFVLPQRRG